MIINDPKRRILFAGRDVRLRREVVKTIKPKTVAKIPQASADALKRMIVTPIIVVLDVTPDRKLVPE
jgi:hypothetical protein